MKKRKHSRNWDDETWKKTLAWLDAMANEDKPDSHTAALDSLLDDPEALTEHVKKNYVHKLPIDVTPTHDISYMKREQMDAFAQTAYWLQNPRNLPRCSPEKRKQAIALYRQMSTDLQKAISRKQRLEYSIPEYDSDSVCTPETLYPWDFYFDIGCNYNAYSLLPNGHVVFYGSGTNVPMKPVFLYILALIQNKSDFSPSHLQAFVKVKYGSIIKFKYLPSLDKTSILQFAKTMGFTDEFAQSFHTFLLQNIAFAWGNVPSFLPSKKFQRTCFHPVTYDLWRKELEVRTHLTRDYFISQYRKTDFFKDFNQSLSFYDRRTETGGVPALYMHPYPPVVQFLYPYTALPKKDDLEGLSDIGLLYTSSRFLCVELVRLYLLEIGAFPRHSNLLDTEKTIFFTKEPLPADTCNQPVWFFHIHDKASFDRAARTISTQKYQKQQEELPFLLLNFAPSFTQKLTTISLFPFLHSCKSLILCGCTPPTDLSRTLCLPSEHLSTVLSYFQKEKGNRQDILDVQSLLLNALNQLFAHRAESFNNQMIIESATASLNPDERSHIPPTYTLNGFCPQVNWEKYFSDSESGLRYGKNILRYKKVYSNAAKRVDTLLKPFRDLCQIYLKENKISRSQQNLWMEQFLSALLVDYMVKEGLSFSFARPEPHTYFSAWCSAMKQNDLPTEEPLPALLPAFLKFIRQLSLCESKEVYFARREQSAVLGWADTETLYLDYDRFWPAFLQYAGLSEQYREMRNRFLREMFRPGCPGERFAYQTDVKSGHWGHPIRENKRAKPLGRFLRLKTDILAEESSQ